MRVKVRSLGAASLASCALLLGGASVPAAAAEPSEKLAAAGTFAAARPTPARPTPAREASSAAGQASGTRAELAPADLVLARVEEQYADWLDATSAVATIDSGLMTRVGGVDRRGWNDRRLKLAALLPAALERIDESALGTEDTRALHAMRRGLIENALDPAEESLGDGSAAVARCEDRTTRGADSSDPTELELALYACFQEIGDRVPFEGRSIVRTTALEWLQEIDGTDRRKSLFLAFAPLWDAINGADEATSPYRRLIRMSAAAQRGGRSAIDDAAAIVGTSSAEVERWLEDVLGAWRAHSRGSALEPWDYWYAAAAAGRELAHAVPRERLLPISERFYRDLGADLRALGVRHDLEVRPGKAPLAYTDHIRIGRRIGNRWRPAIPRVSANYEQGGLFVLNELIHEDGHAVQEAALRTRPAFYSLGGDLFDEAFADVPAWSALEPAWQRKYLGRASATASSLRDLYANVMLDIAWGLFELRMLRHPDTDPNAEWTDITSRYLNVVPHPELSWWALRVQLVRWPGYMINYGLGAVLTAAIRARILDQIGPFDTGNSRWYRYVSLNLLNFGASVDTTTLLERFLGKPVSTDALLKQLQRLD
ncbi:MAG TPA: hypothetical protein VK437_07105 [Steroidobacteraceae bacterium]|nr:hypothetical protein [Steroidobacteraceae bacterium]